ncbi:MULTISPECIES: YccF domain-containing protein [Streptomyces]|uniref:YccF domain-containing protein n=1 Tax=Streptomyces mutomycini TaxID=284036 RepID=A0ABW0AY16_9ACTN|nr:MULTISPECIES: YccF domain-containing protein [Streptomyces]KPC79995.1 membrane protein [Streptomyces sp. NRRL S-4]
MKTILNVIWLVLCGLWMFLGYMAAGLLLCITIIGIPFGVAAFRIGVYALWPFGYTVVDRHDAGGGSLIGNVLWVILAGWWLALGHIFTGIALCVTIIGIPLGIANFKLLPVSLMPFGKEIVRTDQPFATR